MKTTHLAALASIALASLTGCGPSFDHLEFVQSTSPPLPVTLERTGVIVPVGIAVACTPIAMDGADPIEDATVGLITTNPSIIDIAPAVDEGYVIFGVSPGHAKISIFVDGEAVGTLPATVIEQ